MPSLNQQNYLQIIATLSQKIRTHYSQEHGYSQKSISAFMLHILNTSIQSILPQTQKMPTLANQINSSNQKQDPQSQNDAFIAILSKLEPCLHEKLLFRIIEMLEQENGIIQSYYASYQQPASETSSTLSQNSIKQQKKSTDLLSNNAKYASSVNDMINKTKLIYNERQPEQRNTTTFQNNFYPSNSYNQTYRYNPEENQYSYRLGAPEPNAYSYGYGGYGIEKQRISEPEYALDLSNPGRKMPVVKNMEMESGGQFQGYLQQLSRLQDQYRQECKKKDGTNKHQLRKIEESLRETLKKTKKMRERINNELIRKQNIVEVPDAGDSEWMIEMQEDEVDFD